MIFKSARVATSATSSEECDLAIRYGRVCFASKARQNLGPVLDLTGYMVLPGLINAHDHLEFNLFPRLGHGPYLNAVEWAKDIYRPAEEPIATHLRLPEPLRLWWGGLKNLLSGVTSVAHHNPYERDVFNRDFPVRVVERFAWAHSLTFSSDAAQRYRRKGRSTPFIIHAAEGTDDESRAELFQLKRAQMLDASTVLVHGVGLKPEDADLLRNSGVSLVWCPSSNLFTLGRTVSRELLDAGISIALGSDSALTARGDLIDELQVARCYVTATRLYNMVTSEPARILRLCAGQGYVKEGGIADLLIVQLPSGFPAAVLDELRPELVLLRGRLKLISTCLAKRLGLSDLSGFEPIEIEGRGKWLVQAKVKSLVDITRQILGRDFRLSGRRVLACTP